METISPFFSVIICTYNRGYLLPRALDSLIDQSCTEWEAIVIDDGSKDDTADVIKPYISERIHYFPLPHKGLAESRNRGIKRSKGKYITFLDSDDAYKINHLMDRKNYLSRHPEVDLLHSNAEVIGDQFVPDKDNPDKLIAIDDCVVGGTFVIKRVSLDVADLFHDGYSDDSRFYEHFVARDKRIAKIDSPTYIYYRDSDDSLCKVAGTDKNENK